MACGFSFVSIATCSRFLCSHAFPPPPPLPGHNAKRSKAQVLWLINNLKILLAIWTVHCKPIVTKRGFCQLIPLRPVLNSWLRACYKHKPVMGNPWFERLRRFMLVVMPASNWNPCHVTNRRGKPVSMVIRKGAGVKRTEMVWKHLILYSFLHV